MFSEHCTEYYEKDLIVIPLRGKIPVIQSWSRFAEKKPSEVLISSWENKHKKKNIGLLCGKLSGVVAIDIDKESALNKVPPSPVAKKGKKGETRFFKYNGEINFKRHDLGIELLSNGNQTVLPPSIHPETNKAYYWTTPDTLLSYDIDDLPTLPESWFKSIGAVEIVKGDSKGRHNKLVDIASAMIERGEETTEVIKEMIDFDNDNHSPPYFTDKTEPHKGTGYIAALKLYTSLATTIERKGNFVQPQTLEIKIGTEEVEKKIEAATKKRKKIPFPKPEGMILELTKLILSRSNKPRAKFAMSAALGLVGTILSNKVKYKDSSPNLYQLIIADSGEGKDAPLKAPKKILIEMKMLKYVGLDQYRSDKSIVKRLEKQRERVDTIDEVSKLFKALNSASNPYLSGMAETLTEIWNASNELFMGMTTAEGTTGMTFNPCLTLMGGTTPDAFSRTFSSANMMQGFGGRFLYVFDDSKADLIEPVNAPMSKDLKDWLFFWGSRKVQCTNIDMTETGNNTEDKSEVKTLEKPNPVELPIQAEAKKYLEETMYHFHELGYHCSEMIRPIVLRAYQQTKKIMIISAVANAEVGSPAPIIKVSDIEFARKYVEASLKQTEMFFAENLIQSRFHAQSKKVLSVLKKSKGMTKTELTKALRRDFKASELYDKKQGLITNLVEAEKILCVATKDEQTKRSVIKFYYNFDAENQ